jgi:hypothetical protein
MQLPKKLHFFGPWCWSRDSSRNHPWGPKNRGLRWDNLHMSTTRRRWCTRWSKRCSTRQRHAISAKSTKLSQQLSSSVIFRGRRSSLTTQPGQLRQIRVPMGGTLHRDRSNTRRSLSTTRQENGKRWEQPVERRATMTLLCV